MHVWRAILKACLRGAFNYNPQGQPQGGHRLSICSTEGCNVLLLLLFIVMLRMLPTVQRQSPA